MLLFKYKLRIFEKTTASLMRNYFSVTFVGYSTHTSSILYGVSVGNVTPTPHLRQYIALVAVDIARYRIMSLVPGMHCPKSA